MPAVVDDILIAWAVVPFLDGLRDEGFKKAYAWLDQQGVHLRPRWRFWGKPENLTELTEQLGRSLDANPGASAVLVSAVLNETRQAGDKEFLEPDRVPRSP